jgi:hypothetical protein
VTVDWSNEEYVRVYTRETADDLDLSWEALALWRAMLIKFDRSGLLSARNGWLSVARLTRIPVDVVERVGPELIKDGRIKATKSGFMAPNFIDAQTASKSDRVRQKESRDRRRENAVSQITESKDIPDTASQPVTNGHVQSQQSHELSQNVTLTSALLCDPDTDPSALRCSIPPAADTISPQQTGFDGLAKKCDDAKRERERKTKLPSDWVPTRDKANLEAEAEAKARGVDLRTELKKLHDWAKSKGEKRIDWDSVWRNWTRSAKPSGQQTQSGFDAVMRIAQGDES